MCGFPSCGCRWGGGLETWQRWPEGWHLMYGCIILLGSSCSVLEGRRDGRGKDYWSDWEIRGEANHPSSWALLLLLKHSEKTACLRQTKKMLQKFLGPLLGAQNTFSLWNNVQQGYLQITWKVKRRFEGERNRQIALGELPSFFFLFQQHGNSYYK